MKSVLLSIQPKWCKLIFSGEKTIEVRKTAPKPELPFKVYMYESLGKKFSCSRCEGCPIRFPLGCNEGAGAVVGEFVCDKVRAYIPFGLRGFELFPEWLKEMCLSKEQLDKYGGLKTLYGWHISDLKIYDKPKELGEFRKVCLNGKCSDCIYEECKITRPPMSWRYVEEVEECQQKTN